MLATEALNSHYFFTSTFSIQPPGQSQARRLLEAQPFLKAKKKTKKSYATFGRRELCNCKLLGQVGS
jgi:hypothetical protein